MKFTYNLYKKHFEDFQIKKSLYKIYPGTNNREFWAKKDEKEEFPWKPLAGAGAILALLVGSVTLMNMK